MLKPLPIVSPDDADFISAMITKGYVPYLDKRDGREMAAETIKALGLRLFPFSPYSFQLAMCVYDWTTASFARMVFMKIFEYTGMSVDPFPLDRDSIAQQIWASNWGPYTPRSESYMRSFLMKPADSLCGVRGQLEDVALALQNFSAVEHRLLSAAAQALPRTSIFEHPRLFSGQVDIQQLGRDHFGIEFLECPLNVGPVGEELVTPFAAALETFVSPGKIITTKMVWSFADSFQDAMHYSNGILLVADAPEDSAVWDMASYVTELSDDPNKIEYVFMPGTRFKVKSVDNTAVGGKETVVITLQPQPLSDTAPASRAMPTGKKGISVPRPQTDDVVDTIEQYTLTTELPHSKHKSGGRRCACASWK